MHPGSQILISLSYSISGMPTKLLLLMLYIVLVQFKYI